MFDHIIGNDQAKAYLTSTAAKGKVGNSLLFTGPEGIGKSLFAEAFAKLLICQNDPDGVHKRKLDTGNHPDLHIYRPEGKIAMHSIGSMRQFSEEVYLSNPESPWKVFIIHDADRMLTYSANALLKTFEEPAKNAVIILLTSNPESLLPTVLSRCRTVYFHPIQEDLISHFIEKRCEKSKDEAIKIAAMAHGSIGHALRLAESNVNPLRDNVLNILSKGVIKSYKDLTSSVALLAESIEADKKSIESEIRASLLSGTTDHLNATQKQTIEKEVEGAVSIHASREAHAIFDVILGWYRDIELLKTDSNPSYLIHPDQSEQYEKALKAPQPFSIDEVQKLLRQASLSIERSTSIQITLENLFLQLNFL